jgi:hypothetical protein
MSDETEEKAAESPSGLMAGVASEASKPAEAKPEDVVIPHLKVEKDENAPAEPPKAEERPTWLPAKYKTPEDLRKGYDELQKAFSRGEHKAPEDGKYDLGAIKDVGIAEDDPLLSNFIEAAKDEGLSQKAVSAVLAKVGAYLADVKQSTAVNIDREKAVLGKNADAIIKDTQQWAIGLVNKGVWSADDISEFESMAGTGKAVRMLQKMRAYYEGPNVPVVAPPPSAGRLTKDDLQSLVADPRYGKDPAFTADVEKRVNASFV